MALAVQRSKRTPSTARVSVISAWSLLARIGSVGWVSSKIRSRLMAWDYKPGLGSKFGVSKNPDAAGVSMHPFSTGGWHAAARCAEIGRGSWRERVCQYVYVPVVAVSLKQKKRDKGME